MDPRGNQHQLFCFAVSLDGLVIIPHLSGKCNPFFEIFSKKFLKGESGGENLPLPSDPGAGRPASPVVETPRPNRRVRVLPAAGEKTSRFPRAQARAAQPARLLKLRAQTGACASCPPQAKKTAALLGDCFQCWRKPIFPGRHQPSIFGAGELNFRVRDGNGWTLAAINTNYFVLPSLSTAQ